MGRSLRGPARPFLTLCHGARRADRGSGPRLAWWDMGDAPTVEDARRAASSVAEDPRVEEVRLFGSVARGGGDRLSDIDLLVVLDDGAADSKEAARAALKRRAVEAAGRDCDVVVRLRREWEHLTGLSASFEAAVAGDSTVVFARPGPNGDKVAVDSSGWMPADNVDIAVDRLRSAANELQTVRSILAAVPVEEEQLARQVAAGTATAEEGREERNLRLLAGADLAIELALKAIIAVYGGQSSRTHRPRELLDEIQDEPAREEMTAIVERSRSVESVERIWRSGVYGPAEDDDWRKDMNTENALAHIEAAVSAVQAAARVLDEKATRPRHRAVASRALDAAQAITEAAPTVETLTTGAVRARRAVPHTQ